jgi:hypothetical protein
MVRSGSSVVAEGISVVVKGTSTEVQMRKVLRSRDVSSYYGECQLFNKEFHSRTRLEQRLRGRVEGQS